MKRHRQVTPEGFLVLIAEKTPDIVYYSVRLSSFDWQYHRLTFDDSDITYMTEFNGSAHATPNVPDELLSILQQDEMLDGDAMHSIRKIIKPADLLHKG